MPDAASLKLRVRSCGLVRSSLQGLRGLSIFNVGSAVRFYFNLTNGEARIRDEEGIEVSGTKSALMAAMEMIEELRAEDPSSVGEWQGWRLEIVDSSGRMVHAMPLGPSVIQ